MGKLRESLADLAACGLPCALEAMGERWSFMILRASFNGVCHFEEFLDALGIARNILSNRLSRLVEAGILKREHCADDRRRIEYRLTPKGMDLLPAMLALRQWGEKWEMNVPANPVLAIPATGCRSCRSPSAPTMIACWAVRTSCGAMAPISRPKTGWPPHSCALPTDLRRKAGRHQTGPGAGTSAW
jgi:DNA-binding HxlR family transcriptional regulator